MEATVVKTGEIRGSKQLFTSCFLLFEKKKFPKYLISNNYDIAHKKNHVKNNNEQTFN